MKYWDIKQPRDNWERSFAFMSYQVLGVRMLFAKRIEVTSPKTAEEIFDSEYEFKRLVTAERAYFGD